MRDLMSVFNECKSELDAIGIQYGKIVSIAPNHRAKTKWGTCTRRVINCAFEYSIEVNIDLLDERCDINGLKNTIIHEILHTCDDCFSHTGTWALLAKKVNDVYGYNIRRTSSEVEKGLSSEQIAERMAAKMIKEASRPEYIIECVNCHGRHTLHRKGKWYNEVERYRCGECGGKLIRV